MDLSVKIGSLALKNPLIAASGCFGYGVEYADILDLSSLGGLVSKGLYLAPRDGCATPRIVETPSGLLNAIGLQGVGVRAFVEKVLPALRDYDTAVLVNVCGDTVDEYAEVTRIVDQAEGVAGVEINISCPNVKEGGVQFGNYPDMSARVPDTAVAIVASDPLVAWAQVAALFHPVSPGRFFPSLSAGGVFRGG